jgi:hypothetical protein
MANFTTTYDLVQGALSRAGELQDGTSQCQSSATRYANQIYLSIFAGSNEFNVELGEPWPWALASTPGTFNLVLPYETGTVSLILGSNAGTFSVAPAVSLVGWYLKIADRPEYFRIATHVAASTSFTIDTQYTETTGAALAFKAIKLEYDLPSSVLRLVGPMRVYRLQDFEADDEGKIYGIEKNSFSKDFPLHNIIGGVPTYFTEIQQSVPGVKRVMFNKYVSEFVTKVEFDYIPFPEDLFNYVFADSDVNVGSNHVTIENHGIPIGTRVQFENAQGSLPAPLAKGVTYFVVSPTNANEVHVSTTEGGSPVNITSAAGGGQHFIFNTPIVPKEHRKAIEYAISAWLCTDKNDSQAEGYTQLTQASLEALVQSRRREGEHISKDRGRLIPRLDIYRTKRFLTRYTP